MNAPTQSATRGTQVAHNSSRAPRALLAALAAAAIIALAITAHAAAGKPLTWKLALNAFLRVDDQPVKEWNAFQIEKKNDRFLLQWGARYLLVDGQQKQVFELPSASIDRSGPDLLWDPADRPEKPMATSEWIVRDVGMALRIKVHLEAENRTLDLQLSHPPARY